MVHFHGAAKATAESAADWLPGRTHTRPTHNVAMATSEEAGDWLLLLGAQRQSAVPVAEFQPSTLLQSLLMLEF